MISLLCASYYYFFHCLVTNLTHDVYLCIEIPLSSLDLQPTRSVRSNTGETFVGRLVLRQKDALMVPNLRACSRGGSAPRDSSGSLVSGEKISPRIVSVRSNTGETPGSRPLQRQEDALMVSNPRACSRGRSAPRDSSGSLASGGKISSRIVSVRSNTGETPGNRPLQHQEDALMVPNPRACSRGGSAPRDSSGSLESEERFPPE